MSTIYREYPVSTGAEQKKPHDGGFFAFPVKVLPVWCQWRCWRLLNAVATLASYTLFAYVVLRESTRLTCAAFKIFAGSLKLHTESDECCLRHFNGSEFIASVKKWT